MDTKQQIINKAFALFMSGSYKDVTISRLLKETGLSKGAFYHHFESKEQLFTRVVDQFFFGAAADTSFSPSTETGFLNNMENFLITKVKAFEFFSRHLGIEHKEINFFMFIIQAIRYLPGIREKVEVFMNNEKKMIHSILSIAAGKGEIRPDLDLQMLSALLMSAFDGMEMHGVLVDKSEMTIEKEISMIRNLWELIKQD